MFNKTIEVEIDGIEYEEEWELKLHFTPGEKMIMYYKDGSGYPGSPAEVELISAELIERTDLEGKKVNSQKMVMDGSDWFERAGIKTDQQMMDFDDWAFEQCEDTGEDDGEYDRCFSDPDRERFCAD